jgi:hypothetical protein
LPVAGGVLVGGSGGVGQVFGPARPGGGKARGPLDVPRSETRTVVVGYPLRLSWRARHCTRASAFRNEISTCF